MDVTLANAVVMAVSHLGLHVSQIQYIGKMLLSDRHVGSSEPRERTAKWYYLSYLRGPVYADEAQQIVGVVALGVLLFRLDVVAVVSFALVIRRRNSTLC